MSRDKPLDLYELLPAFCRIEDARQGYPLKALLEIISEQGELVRQNIRGLWDDFFIETCAEWLVPYIGDLVGNNPIHEAARGRRADVAKTIYYRRRKGTLPMLEEMARDVTGWGAHAVAFFEMLGWRQNLNHLRFEVAANPEKRDPWAVNRVGTVNLRNQDLLDLRHGPFDRFTHTVDVRPGDQQEGWYNISKIGFFLWRLRNYPLTGAIPQPCRDYKGGYHFSPLGNPAPLFTFPQPEADETGLATEMHVPGPIRPLAFAAAPNAFYGPDRSFTIDLGPGASTLTVVARDLRPWPSQDETPPPGEVWVDVNRGRFALAKEDIPSHSPRVSYSYGFSGDLGGGPYSRSGPEMIGAPATWTVLVTAQPPDPLPANWKPNLQEALNSWDQSKYRRALITIGDCGTYQTPGALPGLADNQHLIIQAGAGTRPTLSGDLLVARGGREGRLTLEGLLIQGSLRVGASSPGLLEIRHCTLVPGRALDEDGHPRYPGVASIEVESPNPGMYLEIEGTITGPLRLPEEMQGITIRDSIIDALPLQEAAQAFQTLVSGSNSAFAGLPAGAKILVAMGGAGPFPASLEQPVATLEEARKELEAAIRRVHPDDAFKRARVGLTGSCLVVLPGAPEVEATISPAPGDDTAVKLRLAGKGAKRLEGLRSRPLPARLGLETQKPALQVAMGKKQFRKVEIAGKAGSLRQIAAQLQRGLRRINEGAAWKKARVITVSENESTDRLVILPGDAATPVRFKPVRQDRLTLAGLGLGPRQELTATALGAGGTGMLPGPPAILERTTIFGQVKVKQLTYASEVIFNDPVIVSRCQEGCVRFSYLPDNSTTPRRYRCQPDLALQSMQSRPGAAQDLVRVRLRPAFTSMHFGDPGYAQLSLRCAREICTGAENEAEMGAFNHLWQPQRETNLRLRLEEYLPFGLDPVFIYVT